MNAFVNKERQNQGAFLTRTEPALAGYRGSDYRLPPANFQANLVPSIRQSLPKYLDHNKIQKHLHISHGMSSQVACFNFLAPLAQTGNGLAQLIQAAFGGEEAEILPVETGPEGDQWYVGFEWIGGNYLKESNEKGERKRGANATAADAVIRCRRGGRRETILIEWKYSESYGTGIASGGNDTRRGRYSGLAFAPNGPIRSDLGISLDDFFWEPYYQLLRQQMLAFQMEKAKEDGADIVRLLHLSPRNNTALKKVTSPALRPFGVDLETLWPSLLATPDRFKSGDIGALFHPLLASGAYDAETSDILSDRYRGILMPEQDF